MHNIQAIEALQATGPKPTLVSMCDIGDSQIMECNINKEDVQAIVALQNTKDMKVVEDIQVIEKCIL